MPAPDTIRRRYRIRGRVQGVGFRPFVYRLATGMALGGWVGNDSDGVFLELEGAAGQIENFERRLREELPPLACLEGFEAEEVPASGEGEFRILPSRRDTSLSGQYTPDAALCADCAREMADPADRRYRYPFINCTNCGPRYSIVRGLPYDRERTTMAAFEMCAACRAEYENPADRRFHAEPVACPDCGPRLWLCDADGGELPGDPLAEAARLLAAGRIVAVKGLGGFHLACRADNEEAVAALRRRKGRAAKPFALMAADLEAAAQLVELDAQAKALLDGPEKPICLLPRRAGAPLAPSVAPGVAELGLMLPYTPLHALLFAEGLGPLVMTSGNPSEEPLCADNAEAIDRLGGLADAFLLHDRDIERRVDDSVYLAGGGASLPLRRGRGFAPAPIACGLEATEPVLALGGELKSAVCLMRGGEALLSEHLGELTNPAAYRNFLETLDRYQRLMECHPRVLACDLHPAYAASRWARGRGGDFEVVEVQHHHAHVAACLADHGRWERVLGLACDGTGYGTDGAVWGCEFLLCEPDGSLERLAALCYYKLFGGDRAAVEAWRPALGLLHLLHGAAWRDRAERAFRRVDAEALALAEGAMERHRAGKDSAALRPCSSLGRLFDAAAFLLGLADENRFEAEAAMALEAAARRSGGETGPGPAPELVERDAGPWELDPSALVEDLLAHRDRPERGARRFHRGLAEGLARAAARLARREGLSTVALTGGCFANRLLLEGTRRALEDEGLEVLCHRRAPVGDGGVALGQAVLAAARMNAKG